MPQLQAVATPLQKGPLLRHRKRQREKHRRTPPCLTARCSHRGKLSRTILTLTMWPQRDPNASDDNPGTADEPWRTIGKAAAILQPGERVIVHAGIYREWVKPAQGGTGPDRMIAYQAAAGEKVVITGSDRWTPQWKRARDFDLRVDNAPPIYCAKLTPDMFQGANVFCLQNFTIQPDAKTWTTFPSYELRRGQLFLGGRPLTQVNDYPVLVKTENAFWVEENGMTIHVRLAGDKSPTGKVFEITTREQVFAPTTRALNFIRVSGFKIFRAGNGVPIPPPQRGALSATAGHHWIIEDCEIGYANTIGIDIGAQSCCYVNGDRQGFNIVRRNHVHHCGLAGICAWFKFANQNLLVEDNLITDNGWMPRNDHFETAGIKMHYVVSSLIRRNVFLRNQNSAALWLDGYATNNRITQNLMANTTGSPFGSCFMEITHGPNLIDNNIILGSDKHGVYEHDAARYLVVQNLIAGGNGSAVHLSGGDPARKAGNTHPEDDHRVFGNILQGFDGYIVTPNPTSRSDCNVLAGVKASAMPPFQVYKKSPVGLPAWHALGYDGKSVELPLEVTFDEKTLELRVKAAPGARLPEFAPLPRLLEKIPPLAEMLIAMALPMGMKLGDATAPTADLLKADFLGNARDPAHFNPGPLKSLPLNGSPIRVDPRQMHHGAAEEVRKER